MVTFKDKVSKLFQEYEELITRKNLPLEGGNGYSPVISTRW